MDFWRRETLLLLTGINPRIISYLNQWFQTSGRDPNHGRGGGSVVGSR
jgi:hypothetical protein